MLDGLQPGEILDINRLAESRRITFISCIKQRIDTLNDCEFNNDYTKIRKLSDFCNFED
jgi:hypothetical protein